MIYCIDGYYKYYIYYSIVCDVIHNIIFRIITRRKNLPKNATDLLSKFGRLLTMI